MQPTEEHRVICVGDNPYEQQIRQFITAVFPQAFTCNATDLVDLLSTLILGTKQTRFGPNPSPEVTVAIRDVIRKAMAEQKPVPFMVPWGSEKPDGGGIVDIAELMALKQLAELQRKAVELYRPGLDFVIRVEDASAPYLFYETPDAAREAAAVYTTSFDLLVKVLGIDFVTLAPESLFVSEEDFNAQADEFLPVVEQALRLYDEQQPKQAETTLATIGWSGGGIAFETRQFYYGQYEKAYPNKDRNARRHILARYFASAVARRVLKIRGDRPEWEGEFLDLSFVPATPGTENYFGRRVHYRTLPRAMSSVHMPPWRAKGYLEIDETNNTRARLASYNDLPEDLERAFVQFKGNGVEVKLEADYVCV